MPANVENVKRLVDAAWAGMQVTLEDSPASAEDVVNAAMNVASGAIDYAVNLPGLSPEEVTQNKRAIRDTLQRLMLKTTDNLKVF